MIRILTICLVLFLSAQASAEIFWASNGQDCVQMASWTTINDQIFLWHQRGDKLLARALCMPDPENYKVYNRCKNPDLYEAVVLMDGFTKQILSERLSVGPHPGGPAIYWKSPALCRKANFGPTKIQLNDDIFK